MIQHLYSFDDLVFFPIYLILFFVLIRRSNKKLDVLPHKKRLLNRAFLYRVIFLFLFFFIYQFYYKGGDTFLYYNCIVDLHNTKWEIKKDFVLSPIATTTYGSTLSNSFSGINGSWMTIVNNALIVKIGYYISFLCGSSYLAICLFFCFYAYWGSRKLYLLLSSMYPTMYKEFAFACLFLPTLCFWSSSLMKDSVTFGAVCFLIFYIHRMLIRREKIFFSGFWVILSAALVFFIKPYILLAVLPGVMIWVFTSYTKGIVNKQLRVFLSVVFVLMGSLLAFLLINYLTSTEYASGLAAENIGDKIMERQSNYAALEKGGSNYEIEGGNFVIAYLQAVNAALFRPYLWEISSPIMLFSSIESVLFFLFTLFVLFRVGFFRFFSTIFRNTETLFFFIFTIIFAGSVALSTPNFGTLVRYKIPCLPFYLMMLFIILDKAKATYPYWLNKIIGVKYRMVPLKTS